MTANTILIQMQFKQEFINSDSFEALINDFGNTLFGINDSNVTTVPLSSEKEKMFVFTEKNGGHSTLRLYEDGLATLDIQYKIEQRCYDNRKNPYNMSYIRGLLCKLREYFGESCLDVKALFTPIKRGKGVWPYVVTADERLVECDYDEVVFEDTSAFQLVQILHSASCGNVLLLDGDTMLGESDLIYTSMVCALDKEDFKDKEVLILGGGDGGIIHELLKRKPKMVVMAEIDEMVIKACRTHMRSVCGDSMDKYEGPNHKIIIGDCIKVLYDVISTGKTYDYVINDLTEFPVEMAVKQHFTYDFETTSLITELSLKAVKDTGKVLARGNCASADDYKQKFEGDLKKMGVEFLQKSAFVPSFGEIYTFYEIWKTTNGSGK